MFQPAMRRLGMGALIVADVLFTLLALQAAVATSRRGPIARRRLRPGKPWPTALSKTTRAQKGTTPQHWRRCAPTCPSCGTSPTASGSIAASTWGPSSPPQKRPACPWPWGTLSGNAAADQQELDCAVAQAQQHPLINSLVIGNETLLTGALTSAQLCQALD